MKISHVQIDINGRSMLIIAEALGGSNVDNCPHACVARPCGPLATCIPNMENYECHCNPSNALCNKAEELPAIDTIMLKLPATTTTTTISEPSASTSPPSTISYKARIISTDEPNDDLDYEDQYYLDDENVLVDDDEMTTTTIKTSTTSSTAEVDVLDTVTRVLGRYMRVDNDRLLEIERQRRLKKIEMPSSIQTETVDMTTTTTTTTPPMVVDEDDDDDHRWQLNQPRQRSYHVRDDTVDEDVAGVAVNFQYVGENVLTTKELIDDMERIMKNGNDIRQRAAAKHKAKNWKKSRGACFTGADSYFHYNDAETMRRIISYKIDFNLRFKTHSVNGLILWTGRHSALEEDDFLSLGIENG